MQFILCLFIPSSGLRFFWGWEKEFLKMMGPFFNQEKEREGLQFKISVFSPGFYLDYDFSEGSSGIPPLPPFSFQVSIFTAGHDVMATLVSAEKGCMQLLLEQK